MSPDDSSQFEIVEGSPPERSVDPTLSGRLAELHADAWGWALAVTRSDPSEAEEVLQVTYLRILEGRARFHGKSLFKTWVFGVIRRVAGERRRSHAREASLGAPHPDGAPIQHPSSAPGPAENLARVQMSSRLRRALDRLSERQRQILHLVFYQELTIAEAAEVVGISFGSARTHYGRGKANLRKILTEKGV